MNPWQTDIQTLADTDALAGRFAGLVDTPDALPMFVALCGSLGAGKTQFVRSLCAHLGVAAEDVTSPTYVLMQRYRGRISVLHLDFYRLKSIEEVWDLGLDEWLEQPVLVVAEWAELFPACWPDNWLRLNINMDSAGQRTVEFQSHGPRADQLSSRLYAL